MNKYIVEVNGMKCGMCEAHVNDAIRKAFKVKKVNSSKDKCQTEIIAENDISIEMRMPEMETNHCREWHSMPYYALFYDECRNPGLIADWTKLTPYVLSLGSIAKAQLLDPETADFSTRLGLGIIEKHLYSLPLRKEPPVHYIEAFTGVRCIVRLRDPLYPKRSELQQIFDYIRLRNQSPAGDMLLGIRGSDEDENGMFYYVRVLLPTETL